MSGPRFDQRDQSVQQQQNTAGDTYNFYFGAELRAVSADAPREQVIDAMAVVKQAMRREGGSVPPVVAAPPGQPAPRPAMQPFQPAFSDPYQCGAPWLDDLRGMAAAHGDAYVPPETGGLNGVDLTGVWSPPDNPFEQEYIRQAGPYVNFIAGIGGVPTCFAEGVINPDTWFIRLLGRYASGIPVEVSAQLFTDWSLRGEKSSPGPFGFPVGGPLWLRRVA